MAPIEGACNPTEATQHPASDVQCAAAPAALWSPAQAAALMRGAQLPADGAAALSLPAPHCCSADPACWHAPRSQRACCCWCCGCGRRQEGAGRACPQFLRLLLLPLPSLLLFHLELPNQRAACSMVRRLALPAPAHLENRRWGLLLLRPQRRRWREGCLLLHHRCHAREAAGCLSLVLQRCLPLQQAAAAAAAACRCRRLTSRRWPWRPSAAASRIARTAWRRGWPTARGSFFATLRMPSPHETCRTARGQGQKHPVVLVWGGPLQEGAHDAPAGGPPSPPNPNPLSLPAHHHIHTHPPTHPTHTPTHTLIHAPTPIHPHHHYLAHLLTKSGGHTSLINLQRYHVLLAHLRSGSRAKITAQLL